MRNNTKKIFLLTFINFTFSFNLFAVCTSPISDLAKIFSKLDSSTNLCAQDDVTKTAHNMAFDLTKFCKCVNVYTGPVVKADKLRIINILETKKYANLNSKLKNDNTLIYHLLQKNGNKGVIKACPYINKNLKISKHHSLLSQEKDDIYLQKLYEKIHNDLGNGKASFNSVMESIDSFNQSIYPKHDPDFLGLSVHFRIFRKGSSASTSNLASLIFESLKKKSPKESVTSFKKAFKQYLPIFSKGTCNHLKNLNHEPDRSLLNVTDELTSTGDKAKQSRIIENTLKELSYDDKINFQRYYCEVIPKEYKLNNKKIIRSKHSKVSSVCKFAKSKTFTEEDCHSIENKFIAPYSDINEILAGALENKKGFQRKTLNKFTTKLDDYLALIEKANKNKNLRTTDKLQLAKQIKVAKEIKMNLDTLRTMDTLNDKLTKAIDRNAPISKLKSLQLELEQIFEKYGDDMIVRVEDSALEEPLYNKFENFFTEMMNQTNDRYAIIDDTIEKSSRSITSQRNKRARKTITVDQPRDTLSGTPLVDKSTLPKNTNPEIAPKEDSTESVATVTEPKDSSAPASSKIASPTQRDPSLVVGQPESKPVIANIPYTTTYPTSGPITDPAPNLAIAPDNQDTASKHDASVIPVKTDDPQATSTSKELQRMREQIAELTATKKETKNTSKVISKEDTPIVIGGGSSVSSSSSKGSSGGSYIQDQPIQSAAAVINNQIQNPQIDTKEQDHHNPVQKITGNESASSDSVPLTLTKTRYKAADITSEKTVVEFHISEEEFAQKTGQQKEEIIYAELEDAVTSNDVKEGDVIKIGNELIPITKELIAQIKAKKLAKDKKIAKAAAKKAKPRKPANKKKKVPTQEGPSVTTQQLLDALQ